MFIGTYNHTIDTKGRLIIPNKFRALLGESFVITKGIDGCLAIYTKEQFETLSQKISENLKMTDKKAREFKRIILGFAFECVPDKMGRVLISKELRDLAKLNEDITFVGVGDYIEVWDSSIYREKNDFENDEDLADSLEGLGI